VYDDSSAAAAFVSALLSFIIPGDVHRPKPSPVAATKTTVVAAAAATNGSDKPAGEGAGATESPESPNSPDDSKKSADIQLVTIQSTNDTPVLPVTPVNGTTAASGNDDLPVVQNANGNPVDVGIGNGEVDHIVTFHDHDGAL
jgi:hypothetical protein